VNPQTKSLVEGRAAGMAFVNLGGDLIAERGVSAACSAAKAGGLAPFMSAQGGKSRYETGSHVDVSGFSLMAGLALTKPTAIGDATLGAFFESGWGSYDAHNSFSNAASVDADGDNSYYGGGVLARMDFADFGPGHAYAEASLRAGWTDTDYGSSDLRDAFGNSAAYDSGAAYYGAHFGLGYEWKLNEVAALDFYTKYFWTHQEGDNVSVVGDPIEFGDTDSHRLRLGARYSHELNASGMVFKPYVGAAYEYEFDGETGGTTYGLDMDKPELKGSTGMGELGVTFQPTADSSFTFDLGVQGYTGVREGVSGSFMLKYKF
jgi:outer membrane autotransporter protein